MFSSCQTSTDKVQRWYPQKEGKKGRTIETIKAIMFGTAHQNGPEDCRTDTVSNLKLSLFVGACEVVFPPGAKHPKNNQINRR